MATMSDLTRANAKFQEQMTNWKRQRLANGEDPMDWVAFRKHLQAIGAPDPGETAPDEFNRWDDSMYGGTPDHPRGGTGWATGEGGTGPA